MILTVTLNASIDKRYVVEGFWPAEVNRVKECRYSAGGKGLNVSRVLTIAGADVLATGFVGGYAGKFILEELRKEHIAADFISVEGESRSCINIYDTVTETQTEFLEPGVLITEQGKEAFFKKFCELCEKCSVVAMSGSAPKGVETSFYAKLVKHAKEHQKKVLLDTSGAALFEAIAEKPTLIKPNMDEIQAFTKTKGSSMADIIRAAKEIHAQGIPYVVVSLGKEGSVAVAEDKVYRVRVPKIDAVNTVGCGDSMIAGLALGFEEGLPFAEALRKASAISSASALTVETGFFRAEDYDTIYPDIELVTVHSAARHMLSGCVRT